MWFHTTSTILWVFLLPVTLRVLRSISRVQNLNVGMRRHHRCFSHSSFHPGQEIRGLFSGEIEWGPEKRSWDADIWGHWVKSCLLPNDVMEMAQLDNSQRGPWNVRSHSHVGGSSWSSESNASHRTKGTKETKTMQVAGEHNWCSPERW